MEKGVTRKGEDTGKGNRRGKVNKSDEEKEMVAGKRRGRKT